MVLLWLLRLHPFKNEKQAQNESCAGKRNRDGAVVPFEGLGMFLSYS